MLCWPQYVPWACLVVGRYQAVHAWRWPCSISFKRWTAWPLGHRSGSSEIQVCEGKKKCNSSPYLWFHFPWSQSSKVNHSLKVWNGKFQKYAINKRHSILSSMMSSPTWDVTPPFVQSLQAVCPGAIIHRVALPVISSILWHHSACVRGFLILLHNGPQSARVVMLAIHICQREAVTCFLSVERWKVST